MKYWLVVCYVGHCGKRSHGNHRDIALAIEATTSVEALMMAKRFPGVRHSNSRYICSTREITMEEYYERRKFSAYEKALR